MRKKFEEFAKNAEAIYGEGEVGAICTSRKFAELQEIYSEVWCWRESKKLDAASFPYWFVKLLVNYPLRPANGRHVIGYKSFEEALTALRRRAARLKCGNESQCGTPFYSCEFSEFVWRADSHGSPLSVKHEMGFYDDDWRDFQPTMKREFEAFVQNEGYMDIIDNKRPVGTIYTSRAFAEQQKVRAELWNKGKKLDAASSPYWFVDRSGRYGMRHKSLDEALGAMGLLAVRCGEHKDGTPIYVCWSEGGLLKLFSLQIGEKPNYESAVLDAFGQAEQGVAIEELGEFVRNRAGEGGRDESKRWHVIDYHKSRCADSRYKCMYGALDEVRAVADKRAFHTGKRITIYEASHLTDESRSSTSTTADAI